MCVLFGHYLDISIHIRQQLETKNRAAMYVMKVVCFYDEMTNQRRK